MALMRNTTVYMSDGGGKKKTDDEYDALYDVARGQGAPTAGQNTGEQNQGQNNNTDESLQEIARTYNTAPGQNEQPRSEETGALEKSGYERWKESGDYRDLVRYYDEQSRRAMDDTLGRVSARTGGMASSYAVGAAEGARDNVMLQLEEVARSTYDDAKKDARARIATFLQNGGDLSMLSDEILDNSGYSDEELAQMSRAAAAPQKSKYYDAVADGLKNTTEQEALVRLTGLAKRGFITEEEMYRLLIGRFGRLPAAFADAGTDVGSIYLYDGAEGQDEEVGEITKNSNVSFKNPGATSYKEHSDNVQVKIGKKKYEVQIGAKADEKVQKAAEKAQMRYGVFGYDGEVYVAANGTVYELEKRTSTFKEDYNKLTTDFFK